MIGTFLNAAQCNKRVEAAAEDELNQQFHSIKEWPQKENELNPNMNENENEKPVIEYKKFVYQTQKISEFQDDHQSINTKDNYISIPTDDFSTDQNLKISFDSSISNDSQRTQTTSTFSKSKLNYSDLVRNSTNFLRNIISSLQAEDEPYDMSDWEDEEALKQLDFDIEAEVINGKKIPSWACGNQLAIALSKQNQYDGDRIFQDLPRKVNLFKMFPYYQQSFR